MGSAHGAGTASGFGRGTTALAMVAVQLAAFALAFAADRPTLYAVFAVLTAAGVAYATTSDWFSTLAATFGAGLLVVLGLPLLMLVARQDPALVSEAIGNPSVRRALFLAVYAPFLAAVVAVALGVPLAFLLARGFRGRAFVESLVDLPLVVPHSVAGLAVLFAFGKGAAFPQLTVLGTMTGMVIAMVFVSAPFAVNAAREAFEAVDTRMQYAARTLGASPFETFRRVTAPLALRGMVTGGVLAWARAVSEFGAVAVVAYSVEFFYPPAGERVTTQHAPVFIYNTFLSAGLDESGAVAVLLLALCAGIFLLVRWLTNDSSAVVQ